MLKEQKNKEKPHKTYLRFSSLAFQMALIIYLGSSIGQWFDEKWQTNKPYFTVIFSLFFIAASLYYVLRAIKNVK